MVDVKIKNIRRELAASRFNIHVSIAWVKIERRKLDLVVGIKLFEIAFDSDIVAGLVEIGCE